MVMVVIIVLVHLLHEPHDKMEYTRLFIHSREVSTKFATIIYLFIYYRFTIMSFLVSQLMKKSLQFILH